MSGTRPIRICGVTISGSKAALAIVDKSDDGLLHIAIEPRKIELNNDKDAEHVRSFSTAISDFAHANQIDYFAIKSRQSKGVMGSGGVTFKMEGLIQLQQFAICEFVSPQAITKVRGTNLGGIPGTVLKYQEDAYLAAASLSKKI